jgi:hypothetical protein
MSTRLTVVLGLAAALATTACKKSGKDAAGGGDDGAGTVAVKIPQLALQADTTADAKVSDMSMGKARSYMVMGSETLFTVSEVGESAPATLEAAIEEAKVYDGVQFTKKDKTADGWDLEFQNKGSLGANYFVDVRRKIGGRAISCTTTASRPEQATKAVAACKSLRPI